MFRNYVLILSIVWDFNIYELENINKIKESKVPCIRLRLDNKKNKYEYITNLILNNFYL